MNLDQLVKVGETIVSGDNRNWSDIKSELIAMAARLCAHYSSDVIYDIIEIENYLEKSLTEPVEPMKWYLGFRHSGVDHPSYIQNRTRTEYRAMVCIELRRDRFNSWRMELYHVEPAEHVEGGEQNAQTVSDLQQ